MKRTVNAARLPLGVAVLLSLLLAPAADAAVRKLAGGVQGDSNAQVSMKVVKKNGTPKKVKAFKFKNLDHECSDGIDREFDGRMPGKIPIDKVGTKFSFFELDEPPSGLPAPDDRNQLFVNGDMRRQAKRVTGQIHSTIRLAPVPPAVANTCTSDANPDFRVRK